MTPETAFSNILNRVRARGPVLRLGVAVSGGGDSMAVLRLANDWCQSHGADLFAATVDHGLRAAAADEAVFVSQSCEPLGVTHDILALNVSSDGNLQNAARCGRYDRLADWAKRHDLDAVLLGHTADDQAENFIMRLARGSGVDGLAAMRSDWSAHGVRWLRPVLGVTRTALRRVLQAHGQQWIEDPSNDDTQFERVRVRSMMQEFTSVGLDRSRLVETADRMRDARVALSWLAHDAAQKHSRVHGGDVRISLDAAQTLPVETRHRLLAHAINYVSSTPYRPRYGALRALEDDVLDGKARTLQGCLVALDGSELVVGRELKAVSETQAQLGHVWDGRWILSAPEFAPEMTGDKLVVKALGDGLQLCKDWRRTGFGRKTLLTSPSLWVDGQLHAAPLAGLGDLNLLTRTPRTEDYLSRFLSH